MNEVKIPKRLQQPFSRLMFWLARQYKKTDESLLGRLNSWQKSEIRSGQRFSKYYKAKSQLALSGFRITEIYTEDEIPKMLSAIYQKFSKELNEQDFPKTSTTYWASTGFSKIGSISNVAPKWSFTGETITAKGLRKEIERIDIVFYKVLPSIVGLAFDIFLTEDARKTYEAMTVNSAVKPKTTLLSYYPSARFFRISGFNTIPTSFTNASTWIDSLLADTTRLVKDLFGGLISANLSMSMQHLPAIEIYVANPPITRPKQWLDKNRLFLHQFTGGFSDAFGTSGLLLLWAEKKIDSEVADNHKIIVSPKPFFRKSPIVSPGQVSTEYAHLYLSNYDMNDWFPHLASIYLLGYLQASMNRFRREVSKKASKIPGLGIQSHVNVLARFQKSHYIFQQFEKEIERFLRNKPIFSSQSDLNRYSKHGQEKRIFEFFEAVISWNKALMLQQFSILESFYSNYLSLINSSVTNRLAQIALLVALLSLVLGLFSDNSRVFGFLVSIINKLFQAIGF